MDRNIIFRLGKNIVYGVVKESKENVLSVEAKAVHEYKNQWKPLKPDVMEVSTAFVITDEFEPETIRFVESRKIVTVESLVRESVVPALGYGNIRFGYSELTGYGDGVWFNEDDRDSNRIDPVNILSNVQLGQFIALEGLRDRLGKLGLVDLNKMETVSEGFVSLKEGINVFMKVEPFRDVTRIHEGTMTAVLGYYKGCVVVEADGEIFWRPLEETTFWDKKLKDKEYYFTLDTNGDFVPDPVQALPSKVAFNYQPTREEDNHNSAPNLPKVSGHFCPMPEIDLSDYTILDEGYTANYYNDDERLAGSHSAEYDNEVEPGLEPRDTDAEIDAEQRKKAADTVDKGDGKDGVDRDDDGEEEYDVPGDGTEKAMEAVMRGASLDHVLSGDEEYSKTFDEEYQRQIKDIFPGV